MTENTENTEKTVHIPVKLFDVDDATKKYRSPSLKTEDLKNIGINNGRIIGYVELPYGLTFPEGKAVADKLTVRIDMDATAFVREALIEALSSKRIAWQNFMRKESIESFQSVVSSGMAVDFANMDSKTTFFESVKKSRKLETADQAEKALKSLPEDERHKAVARMIATMSDEQLAALGISKA